MAKTKKPKNPNSKYVYKYTFPVQLLDEDRDLLDRVRENYSGLSRHMILRAALRKALSEDLSEPGGLAPFITTVRSKLVDQPTTVRSEQVDQEVSSPSTLGKSDELEDFGPGGDFKMNPFI